MADPIEARVARLERRPGRLFVWCVWAMGLTALLGNCVQDARLARLESAPASAQMGAGELVK